MDDIPDNASVISAVRPLPPLGQLPEIPDSDLDLSLDSILGAVATDPYALSLSLSLHSPLTPLSGATETVHKRASNVLKLAQENEKLKAELRAMSERIEAAERKQRELEQTTINSPPHQPPQQSVNK